MLECQSCGLRFSRAQYRAESRGCCFGLPARELMQACPRCGGAFIEIRQGGDSYDY